MHTSRPDIRFTLGATERLKLRKQIDALFLTGKAFSVFPYRIVYHFTEQGQEPFSLKMGVSVSKRKFKHAVDRNRIKLLTREAWRLQKQALLSVIPQGRQLQLFFIFTGHNLCPFEQCQTAVQKAIHHISTRISEETIQED